MLYHVALEALVRSYLTLDFVDMNDSAADSADQDQTARICQLILLYTIRKINPRLRKVRQELLYPCNRSLF